MMAIDESNNGQTPQQRDSQFGSHRPMITPMSLAPDNKMRSGNSDRMYTGGNDKERGNTDSSHDESNVNKNQMSSVSPVISRLFGDSRTQGSQKSNLKQQETGGSNKN